MLGTALLIAPFVGKHQPMGKNGITHFANKGEPRMSRLVNCDETNIQPCWMERGDIYFIVRSTMPWNAYEVIQCAVEDGGPVIPCIWKDNNKEEYGNITRNFFWMNEI
jgi:hypothetical protein